MSVTVTTTEFDLSATANHLAQLEATGATGNIRWSLVPPARLPGGLFMNSDGRITGTPGIAGTFTVVVSALDLGAPLSISGSGDSATQSLEGNAQQPPVGPAVAATVTLTIS